MEITRNMKMLALALVAVCAIGAVVAQGATAEVKHTFFATSAPLELTGEQTGESVVKAGEVVAKCNSATPSGTLTEEAADEISMSFELSECFLGSTEVTVVNEGCKLATDSDTTEDPNTGGESAVGSLECEAGKFLKMTGPGCTIDTGSQGPLHGARYTNVGSAPTEEVEVEAHAVGLKYNATNLGCGLLGISKGEHNDGTLLINARVKGYEAGQIHNEAHQVGIGVETP